MSEKTSWVLELIDRFSAPAKSVINLTNGITGAIDKAARGVANLDTSKVYFAAQNIQNLTAQFDVLTEKTMAYADAISDVQKTTGLTTPETDKLSASLMGLGSRTKINELLDISRVAGEFQQRTTKDVFEFTKAVNLSNVALGDQFGSAENTARKLGILRDLYADTKTMKHAEAMTRIGSVLNELGNKYGTNANNVAEFTQRIGQLGSLATNLTDSAAYGAVLEKLGISAEIGAGGFTKLFTTGAKESKLFAQGLGMTETAFKKMLENDPNRFVKSFLQSLQGLSETEVTNVLNKLKLGGDQETLKTVLALSANLQKVTEYQNVTTDAFKKGNSVLNEAALKENNLAAAVLRVRNWIDYQTVSFGQAVGSALPFISALGTVATTVVFLAPALQILGTTYLWTSAKIGVAAAATWKFIVAQYANTKAVFASGLRFLWFAGVSMVGFVGSLFGATAAQWALNVAMNANPIGLIVLAVAAAVGAIALLIKYWDNLKGYIVGFGLFLLKFNLFSVIFDGLSKIFPETFGKIKAAFGDFWGWLTGLLEKAWSGIKWLWDKIKEILGFGGADISANVSTDLAQSVELKKPAWYLDTFKGLQPDEIAPTNTTKNLFADNKTTDKTANPDTGTSTGGASASARSINMSLNVTQHIHATKDMDIEKLKRTLLELIVDAGRDGGVILAGA